MIKVYPFEKVIRFIFFVTLFINYILIIKPYLFILDSGFNSNAVVSLFFLTVLMYATYYCIFHKFGTSLLGFCIIGNTLFFAYFILFETQYPFFQKNKIINYDLQISFIFYCQQIAVYWVNRRVLRRQRRLSEPYKTFKDEWRLIQDPQELRSKYKEALQNTPEQSLIIKLAYEDTKMLIC